MPSGPASTMANTGRIITQSTVEQRQTQLRNRQVGRAIGHHEANSLSAGDAKSVRRTSGPEHRIRSPLTRAVFPASSGQLRYVHGRDGQAVAHLVRQRLLMRSACFAECIIMGAMTTTRHYSCPCIDSTRSRRRIQSQGSTWFVWSWAPHSAFPPISPPPRSPPHGERIRYLQTGVHTVHRETDFRRANMHE
jgi:hypothetical protein